jgi:DNA polymerase/3'-5' exonuclease PolX
MENLAIARIFSEIADLLEIKSENPFKIRAYRNASETIAQATDKLAFLGEEQLRAIPGIGRDLASKIREIAETGEARFHQDLLQQFPRRSWTCSTCKASAQKPLLSCTWNSASRQSRSSRPRAATAACGD